MTDKFDCPVHRPNAPSGVLAEKCTCTPDEEAGIRAKYQVRRLDGRAVGRCFVLADHDPYAAVALDAYAQACAEKFPVLAADLKTMATEWLKL